MNKEELRKEMKALAGAFCHGDETVRLWARLETSREFTKAKNILLYMSLDDEVPTSQFIERWSGSKRILLPLVKGCSLEIKPYRHDSLAPGYAGIMEPLDTLPSIDPLEVDLAIVPGQAFDLKCRRLGRGKGFYDRVLPQLNCPRFGVAFDWRIVDDIPCDPWDVKMDAVFTPERVILPPDR